MVNSYQEIIKKNSFQNSNNKGMSIAPGIPSAKDSNSPISKTLITSYGGGNPHPTTSKSTAISPITAVKSNNEDYHSVSSGLRRVGDIFNPFTLGSIDIVNPFKPGYSAVTSPNALKNVIRGTEALGVLYGAGAAGLIGTGTTSATVTTTGKVLPYVIGAAAGAGAALLLSPKQNQQSSIDQTPTQNTNPTQDNKAAQETNPTIIPTQSGNSGNTYTAGRDLQYNEIRNQNTNTYTYPSQIFTPEQNTLPSQETGATSSQAQTGGTDWVLIAAIAAGAYFLSK